MGGGNYFFNMVNKGHHVGINPKTGGCLVSGCARGIGGGRAL